MIRGLGVLGIGRLKAYGAVEVWAEVAETGPAERGLWDIGLWAKPALEVRYENESYYNYNVCRVAAAAACAFRV